MHLMRKAVFLHTPKCGGTFVTNCLRGAVDSNGMPLMFRAVPYTAHFTLSEHPPKWVEDKFVFTFVRNPVDWYASFWAHRGRRLSEAGRLDYEVALERELLGGLSWFTEHVGVPLWRLWRPSFEEWVRRVTNQHPGILSALFSEFTRSCDYVGKQESLRDSLIEATLRAGESVDLQHIKLFPAANKSPNVPKVASKLRRRIEAAEAEAMERWGY